MLIIIFVFLTDYNTIKTKIYKENSITISELENEYKMNNCESKGHLNALKVKCSHLKNHLNLHKIVLFSILNTN